MRTWDEMRYPFGGLLWERYGEYTPLLVRVTPWETELIFSGHMTAVVRRERPNVTRGELVLLYATSPIDAVYGGFQVSEVAESRVAEIRFDAAMDTIALQKFLKGAKVRYAIRMNPESVFRFLNPLPLTKLKEMGLDPTQGDCELTVKQAEQLSWLLEVE